jgi:hypothetical protein
MAFYGVKEMCKYCVKSVTSDDVPCDLYENYVRKQQILKELFVGTGNLACEYERFEERQTKKGKDK